MTAYETESGSIYWVDLDRRRVRKSGEEWRPVVYVIADGRLVFVESIIPGADPPLYHQTTTSRIVRVLHEV